MSHELIVLGIGSTILLAGLIWLVIGEYRRTFKPVMPPARVHPTPVERVWTWLFPLGCAFLAGAFVRLFEIDLKSLTHPEIFIPGLPLPPDISNPPPRFTLAETMRFHFFEEPHPWGYYLAMFGWTKIFGTSAAAIRIPEALLGIASIPLIFRVASLSYNRTVGWIAASFLALHGFHIFWSQQARMYVPVCFFGLAATLLLLEICYARRASRLLEAAYVLTIVVGLMTEWFFWLLVGGHILWSILDYLSGRARGQRILYFQLLAIILGSHTLSHLFNTVWHARSGSVFDWQDGLHFILFGYLFDPNPQFESIPDWLVYGGLVLALGLLFKGLIIKSVDFGGGVDRPTPALGALALITIGMTVFMIGLAVVTWNYSGHLWLNKFVWAISVFPILVLAVLPAVIVTGSTLKVRSSGGWIKSLATYLSPIIILAFVPTLAVFIASFFKPMVATRALLIFVPYLLIIFAAGTEALGRRVVVGAPLGIILLALFLTSSLHFHRRPSTPRDYQGLAKAVRERLKPDDYIFVMSKHWLTTPLFYYLNPSHLVGDGFVERLESRPKARVWVIIMSGKGGTNPMMSSLKDYKLVDEVKALNARGLLYIPMHESITKESGIGG